MESVTDQAVIPQQELIVYHGNCHCGAYRFEVTAPEIKEAISCDCTLCAKKGCLWVVPAPGCFKVTRDGGRLVKYRTSASYDVVTALCPSWMLSRMTDNGRLIGIRIQVLW